MTTSLFLSRKEEKTQKERSLPLTEYLGYVNKKQPRMQ